MEKKNVVELSAKLQLKNDTLKTYFICFTQQMAENDVGDHLQVYHFFQYIVFVLSSDIALLMLQLALGTTDTWSGSGKHYVWD